MDTSLQFSCSQKGKTTVVYRGYEFWKKKSLISGSVVWRCVKYRSCKCKAYLVTKGDILAGSRQVEHSHENNVAKVIAKNSIARMKKEIDERNLTPAAALAVVAADLSGEVMMALPDKGLVKRTLRRHRQGNQNVSGSSLPPVPVDTTFVIPDQFRDMLLFDSGPGEHRMIIFGRQELLNAFGRSSFWIADGTFKVVPSLFFQMYTIHFQFTEGITPAALYCLLPNKTRLTYDAILREVQNLIPQAQPETILTDFETAAMSAFRQCYPQAHVRGCYFHLCQSVMRKVQEVGLKAQYEVDSELRGFVRSLSAISHVPINDVPDAFDTLVEIAPAVEHLDEVITYFEHSYVRGRRLRGRGENFAPPLFPPEVWNQHTAAAQGIARTTNTCEGWHHGVQSLFQCSHPTMWKFLEGIRQDSAVQVASFLQASAGSYRATERRYRILKEKVQRAVATYGLTDTLTYLRSLAHLSYA